MKKLICACTAALLAASMLAGCGGQTSAPASGASEPASQASDGSYVVGVCQLAPHPALDAATQGFQDALTEALGDQVTIEVKNAAGDSPTCATIVNGFVSSGVDLIMANATASLQAAVAATSDIPVLGTSVTEYGVALGIEDFSGTVGTNVSGTSDLAPLDQQAAMLKEWFPDAKTVGLLYCSAEPNSQYQVDVVQAELEKLGYTCTQYSFSDTNDMASVTQNAADNSDVIYVPTDNTVPTTPAWWITSAVPRACLSSRVKRASAPAAASPLCPSATMTWVSPPARWR